MLEEKQANRNRTRQPPKCILDVPGRLHHFSALMLTCVSSKQGYYQRNNAIKERHSLALFSMAVWIGIATKWLWSGQMPDLNLSWYLPGSSRQELMSPAPPPCSAYWTLGDWGSSHTVVFPMNRLQTTFCEFPFTWVTEENTFSRERTKPKC